MNFRRKYLRSEVSLDLTPLIDVVFLLLIFFMVSTTFTKETYLGIDLPESSGKFLPEHPKQIEITISQHGDFSVNGQSLVNSRMEIIKRALTKVSQGDIKLPLVISADAKTPYQAVVTAMDAAGQLGFVNLSMKTQKDAENNK